MNFKKIFDSSRKDIDSAVNCSISLMNCGVEYPEYFKNESFLKKIYETIDYVLEQESEHYDILLLKSELLKNQNKLDEALELILKIQSIYPDDLQLKFNQASILLDMEKFHESIEIFCQIQGNFSHHKVLPKLSYAYYKTKSLEQFQNMIAIDRDIKNNKMPDVTYVLAKFEFDQKQWNTCSSLCSWLVKNHQGNRWNRPVYTVVDGRCPECLPYLSSHAQALLYSLTARPQKSGRMAPGPRQSPAPYRRPWPVWP